MAPVFDTDLSENRWSKDGWSNVEFYERVWQRQRKTRFFLLLSAFFAFILLSAVPVIDRAQAQWRVERSTRLLAQELQMEMTKGVIDHRWKRFQFSNNGVAHIKVYSGLSCEPGAEEWMKVIKATDSGVVFLTPEMAPEHPIRVFPKNICVGPTGNLKFEQTEGVWSSFVESEVLLPFTYVGLDVSQSLDFAHSIRIGTELGQVSFH